jgi:P4 family phage/plasmid primase-like protien
MIGKPSTSKSTILGILKILLGINSTVSFALQDFDKENTKAVPSLYGKMANICFDMGMETVKDTGKFKQLTGSNDTLSARMLYVMPFQFNNSAKLTFAANNTPLLSASVEKDEAFWKRIILLHFINQITTEQKDVELSNKLKAHELPGILNWMLVGYNRLLANKRFTNQDSNTIYSRWEATKVSETESDRFFDDCCYYNPEGFVVKEVLRMHYIKWCSTESIRLGKSIIPLSPYKYVECLARIYPEVTGRQERINGEREYVWKGISINTNPIVRVSDDTDQLTLRTNFMARVAKIDADEAEELEHLIKQHEEESEQLS